MLNTLELMELDEVNELQEEEKQAFKVTNIDQANWCLRKISAYKKKSQEINNLAQAEIERIQSWQNKELQQIENSVGYFEYLLQDYFLEEREKNPKFKLSTPYGKVTSRKQQPKWDYDESSLVTWLRLNRPDLIRVKEEVNKVELKKQCQVVRLEEVGDVAVDQNGLIIEGVKVTEQPDKIEVKTEG